MKHSTTDFDNLFLVDLVKEQTKPKCRTYKWFWCKIRLAWINLGPRKL